ncbi:MAG: hypothetical protein RBQ97_04155 [Acholeplasma sp.]|nr:hypothetical protein [Acholeplasma sp.]
MKFRKLTGEDINLIKNLCENRKEYNFFILINLEALKNNQDLIQYYGMFDDNEMLIAVGMFYHRLLYIEISNTGFINVFIN